ncbi:unnamed protein product, partial [Mesorhabditis belari]|uniref:Exoribonuclease phosphorolytic domain-containing protein n=1 Tax=Mesorhabditis belari TaxID=2138241 RepID=A0AAF3FRM5_9BILA
MNQPTIANTGDDSPPKAPVNFRPIRIKIGVLEKQEGTAYVSFGKTECVVQVVGPRSSRSPLVAEKGKLEVTVCGAEGLVGPLKDAMTTIIQLHKYPRASISLNVSVLADDGGLVPVAMIASSLALISAGIEVYDVCTAARILLMKDGQTIVDPPGPMRELPDGSVLLTVVIMPELNQIAYSEILGKFRPVEVEAKIGAAIEAANRLYPLIKKALIAHVQRRIDSGKKN